MDSIQILALLPLVSGLVALGLVEIVQRLCPSANPGPRSQTVHHAARTGNAGRVKEGEQAVSDWPTLPAV